MAEESSPGSGKGPLRWTGIIFAFATNLLLVTIAHASVNRFGLGLNAETLATFLAPLVAGVATALYTRQRGGMHALIGSLIALPFMVLWIFPGVLPPAIFAMAFCTMGAAITEILLRRRQLRT